MTFTAVSSAILAQQIPLSESYYLDKYSLAPSYAGNFNTRYFFLGYRSDWSGIEGGPETFRLSFNDLFKPVNNVGYGADLIYDKAGIFGQLYFLGTYSYNLRVGKDHHILFGLSAGIYRNRLDLLDYYNDPNYHIDPALVSMDISSRLKFMSDFSIVWTWNGIESGFMFSNITIGDVSYKDTDIKYNPLANYQFHATYHYDFGQDWAMAPMLIVRGGKYVMSQVEFAAQVIYMKRFWVSAVYRDPSIIGFGLGADISKGLKISYNFNFATNIEFGAFNNHEVTIGFNIFEYLNKKSKK